MLENQVEELEIMVENYEEKEIKWDIARLVMTYTTTNHYALGGYSKAVNDIFSFML